MEPVTALWVANGALVIVAFFLKRTLDSNDDKVKDLEKDIAEIRRDYLHRDDFKEFKLELRSMFDEIKADIRELKNK